MADLQDIGYCRADFPALSETMHGKRLSYLDTASSAQKPQAVIEAMREVMTYHYANVHRGLYQFSQMTTQAYESVRAKVATFIGAASEREIVFTRNTTEAINLVAQSWGGENLKDGDEIILSGLEHHAGIVPWQLLQRRIGFTIKVIPVLDNGTLDFQAYETLLTDRTRYVGVTHISNALGTINPVAGIVAAAKAKNPDIRVLVDASQSVVHGVIDVAALACDFLVFTGHKLYGPTGSGVLWGREDLLNTMPPYQGGGDMIERVSFEGTSYKPAPIRFEAGTPAFVEIIGLGAAIDYLTIVGQDSVVAHEQGLQKYARDELAKIDGLNFYGPQANAAPILSFTASWASNADIAMVLDRQGVAVRTGHHCCMPLMARLGIQGTIRASIGLYTDRDDINALAQGLRKAKDMLS